MKSLTNEEMIQLEGGFFYNYSALEKLTRSYLHVLNTDWSKIFDPSNRAYH